MSDAVAGGSVVGADMNKRIIRLDEEEERGVNVVCDNDGMPNFVDSNGARAFDIDVGRKAKARVRRLPPETNIMMATTTQNVVGRSAARGDDRIACSEKVDVLGRSAKQLHEGQWNDLVARSRSS